MTKIGERIQALIAQRLRWARLCLVVLGRWFWRKRALAIRGLLAWLLALVFASFDRDNDLDLRFKIRDRRPISTPVVILNVSAEEAKMFRRLEVNHRLPVPASNTEVASEFWEQVIQELLNHKPRAIGITAPSEQILSLASANNSRWPHLINNKVTWSVPEELVNKLKSTNRSNPFLAHIGIDNLTSDYDGMLRRYGKSSNGLGFVAAMAQVHKSFSTSELQKLKTNVRYINFRGPRGTVPNVSLSDLLSSSSRLELAGKIVVVEFESAETSEFLTPVGPLSRAEIFANITDNGMENKWVHHTSLFTVSLILLALVALSGWIMSVYPQAVALFGLIWLATLGTAISIYAFDSAYFLIPILPIWIATISTYMTFLSLQVTIRDYENQQLEKEREFLLSVEELKNNFLSLISHDLKTPIAKLQGICDRILSQTPPPELAQDLLTLREEVSELHRYIRTILQVTRVESRDFRIHPESSDVNELIEAVCEQLSPLAQMKGVQLSLQLEPMFLVEVDPVLIDEIILNLIENAIKYSYDNGRVVVQSREVDDQLVIVVEDNGPGIPEVEHARIFDRFYRGEEGKRQSKGSGLGLYLVKYFVELHGGRIILESQPKRGTKIGFSLPLHEQIAQVEIQNKEEVYEAQP